MSDEEFERAIWEYSEFQSAGVQDTESVPTSILRYNQLIQQNNNSESIFDTGYSTNLDANEALSSEPKHTDFKDEGSVIRIVSGRGRGGKNTFIKPGAPLEAKHFDDDQYIFQQIRKVAPIGYGNEITEATVRAHHKAKKVGILNNGKSPAVSKPTSPDISKPTSPTISEPTSPAISKASSPTISKPSNPALSNPTSPAFSKSISPALSNSSYSSFSKSSSPEVLQNKHPEQFDYFTSSEASFAERSDSKSSDYFTVSDASDKQEANTEAENKRLTVANPKPLSLSQLLTIAREQHKKNKVELQKNIATSQKAAQDLENDIKSQRKINEILEQDRLEEEIRTRRLSGRSSSLSTSSSQNEGGLSLRQGLKTNEQDGLNINSVMDFPPLN